LHENKTIMKKTILLLISLTLSLTTFAQTRHVVIIGIDGLGAYALPDGDMPHLKQVMKEGAWTLKARTVLPSSSGVNWASALMGAGPTLHGYTEWNSAVPEIPSADTTRSGLFPSIFSLLKEQRPEAYTALVYSWQGIGPLVEKGATDYRFYGKDNDEDCVAKAEEVIKTRKPVLTFIHLGEPDGVGHNIGHRTPEYYAELKKVDARIGKILQAVKDAGIAEQTLILITSDHGGTGKGHGGKTLDEVEIPWVLHGPGIRKNHALKSTVIIYDTATTLAAVLKLKTPQSWRGSVVKEAWMAP